MTQSVRTVGGAVLGAALGAASTSFGLISTVLGRIDVVGGNEWTPVLTGGGALVGAAAGATACFRRHIFCFLLATLGLVLAIAIRDRYLVQPPVVFFNLLGVPLSTAILGVLLDRWRNGKATTAVFLVGVGVVGIAISVSLRVAPDA